MNARRVRFLLAATAATGAVALLPASAGAHPEACAATGAFYRCADGRLGELGGRVRRLHEPGRRRRLRRLGRHARRRRVGRDRQSDAALEHAEAGAVRDRGRLQLGPRVRERLRVRRQLRRRPDLGRARRPDAGARVVHPLPGLAERRHGQRRHPRHLDRLAPHQRLVRERGDDHAVGSLHVGGPEDLRRAQSVQPEVPGLGTHRLRLAHAHGAARARPADRLRAVV